MKNDSLKLDLVPTDKSTAYVDITARICLDWNYCLAEGLKYLLASKEYLTDALEHYIEERIDITEGISGVSNVEIQKSSFKEIPVEWNKTYEEGVKKIHESKKQEIKDKIQKLENEAKQLKEKLKLL